VISNRITRRYA